ncbi:hypothetical protein BGZ98_004756, partial [Dissophora globulifera]
DWGWKIFEAIEKYSKVSSGGYSSIHDIRRKDSIAFSDKMETFFLAESLKYLFLLFGPTDVFPLDKYVFNTEAHPFPIFVPPKDLIQRARDNRAREEEFERAALEAEARAAEMIERSGEQGKAAAGLPGPSEEQLAVADGVDQALEELAVEEEEGEADEVEIEYEEPAEEGVVANSSGEEDARDEKEDEEEDDGKGAE